MCHWPTLIRSLLITPPVKPKGLENLPILYPPQQTSHRKRGTTWSRSWYARRQSQETTAGTSTSTSYAGAVKASNQKLTITRIESEGDGGMDNMDLREIQNAITKMILCTDSGFLVHIERTFIFEGKVLMICKDEKTLEWAKQCGWGYCTILGSSSSYDAKGPKDLPLAKTFGIWLPEDDGLSTSIPLRWFPVVMQKSVVRIWKQSIQRSGTKGCYI